MMDDGHIPWKSHCQENIFLSTSETEFVDTTQPGQETLYHRET